MVYRTSLSTIRNGTGGYSLGNRIPVQSPFRLMQINGRLMNVAPVNGIDGIDGWFSDAGDWISDTASDAGSWVKDTASGAASDVWSGAKSAGSWAKSGAIDIKNFTKDAAGNIRDAAGNIVEIYRDAAGNIVDKFGNIIQAAGSMASSWTSNVAKQFEQQQQQVAQPKAEPVVHGTAQALIMTPKTNSDWISPEMKTTIGDVASTAAIALVVIGVVGIGALVLPSAIEGIAKAKDAWRGNQYGGRLP